ncbi:MAG: DUF4097 family beta strand repeat-containing protein [Roseburia sp.]|nr:DUF4097 family beta strand repeat-containing protein [Roseburia sp.]MCM1278866.1 DUF4097 family beta strand repeat-containing protein [Robinsoniella sp.]
MKKGTKFLLLGGFLLSLLGILVIATGVMIGGPENINRMLANGAFSVNVDGTDWNLFKLESDLDWNDYYWGSGWNYNQSFTNTGSAEVAEEGSIREIRANIGGGDIQIEESDEHSGFYIDYEYRDEPCTWTVEDGILTIENKINYHSSHHADGNWNNYVCEITLYVPRGTSLESMEIDLGGGKMELEDINANKTEISMGAGELIMDGLVSKSLSMKIGAGEIKAENAKVENLDVDMSMGNVEYEGGLSKEGRISCSMGNVELNLSGESWDFDYAIDCAAGNVEIENSQFSGLGVTKYIDNGAEKKITVDCAMGNVAIDF